MKSFAFGAALLLSVFGAQGFAQRGGHHGMGMGHGHRMRGGYGPGPKIIVVKRSPYRPAKLVMFHPMWAPSYGFYRRWIFFPKYNFYWDNWRNCYVFWNGGMWIAQPTPPAVIVNVNLSKEKHYELKENEDDVDDVYKSNSAHQQEYKPQ